MRPYSARAVLLVSALIVSGCSAGGGSSAVQRELPSTSSPTTPQTFGNTAEAQQMNRIMPVSKNPASFHVAPMQVSAPLPASAMTSLTPRRDATESISPPSYVQLPGAASQIVAGNTGLFPGVALWVESTAPSGQANKNLFAYSSSGTYASLPGSAARIAVDPTNTQLYAVNSSSGGLYEYSDFSTNGQGGSYTSLGGGVSDVTVGQDGTVYVLSNGSTGDNAVYAYSGGKYTQLPGSGERLASAWDGDDYTLSGYGTLHHDGFYIINSAASVFYYSPGVGYTQLPGKAADIAPIVGGYFALAAPGSGQSVTNLTSNLQISFEDFSTVTSTVEPGSAVDMTAVSPQLYVLSSSGAIYDASATQPNGTSISSLAGSPGAMSTVAGTGSNAEFAAPGAVAVDSSGNIYAVDLGSTTPAVVKITSGGVMTILDNSFPQNGLSSGIAADSNGHVYVASGDSIVQVSTSNGAATTIAGSITAGGSVNGAGSSASFNAPQGLAFDGAGNLYVADTGNCVIRKITSPASNPTVSTFAGTAGTCGNLNGQAGAAAFTYPVQIAIDSSNTLYVTDLGNYNVRKITSGAAVTTLAGSTTGYEDGSSTVAQFVPFGIAVESNGHLLVTSDDTVRDISATGVVTTVAGSPGQTGTTNGTGSAARFNTAGGIALGSNGSLYLADEGNTEIRVIANP